MSTTSDQRDPSTDRGRAATDDVRAAARVRFARSADDLADGTPGTMDPDNPPMTDAQLSELRPAAEVVPGLVAARLRRRAARSGSQDHGTAISIRLDPDVADALRSSGEGWQWRINDLLRRALAIGPGAVSRSEADDVAWLENMGDVVRRAFAGEPVAQDEVRRMMEAVQRHIEPDSPNGRRT